MILENIFYTNDALGKDGERIRIYKIRTMVSDADQLLDHVFSNGVDSLGKVVNDSRVTPLGRFLRKYWLDEIPQIYNLIRGDISLVGIRSKCEKYWEIYPREHKKQALRYKPGLLGVPYSDISISDPNLSFEDLIQIEADYLRQKNESPVLTDFRYFFKILFNIVFRGARSK